MRIGISLLLFTIFMLLGLLKHTEKRARAYEIKVIKLEKEKEERKKVYWKNNTLVCDTEEGELVYLDCGESFSPNAAICICTTSCLEDWSFTVTNSSPEDCEYFHPQTKYQ
jgi:hypothetical protein